MRIALTDEKKEEKKECDYITEKEMSDFKDEILRNLLKIELNISQLENKLTIRFGVMIMAAIGIIKAIKGL